MKPKILVLLTVGLTACVVLASAISELSWFNKENSPNALREIVGLPSAATGNLNPSARNPGVELLCSGLFDVPGGYCSYFSLGVPLTNFTITILEDTNTSIGEK
jgi:hypothetical protein